MAVSVNASRKRSFDSLEMLAAAVMIIFALLWMVTRESSSYLSMHRGRGY
jgi:uncharacterized membrane protein